MGLKKTPPSPFFLPSPFFPNGLLRKLDARRNANSHFMSVVADIRRWQARQEAAIPAKALQMPPGDPI